MTRWLGFISIVSVVALCFISATLPTPLYPIYEQAWSLVPSQISYIFSAYMVPLLAALLCFGRVSDTIGRYPVVLMALFCLIVGLILSAVAQGAALLIFARVVIGFGNGLVTTTAVLALAEAHPKNDKRLASIVASMAISLGFGFGPIVAGSIAQSGYYPLRSPYGVVAFLALLSTVLVVLSRQQLSGPAGSRPPLSIRPQMALPAYGRRLRFLLACMGGFATFTVGSLMAALVPSVMAPLLPWKGPLILGAAFVPMALACAVIQLRRREVEPYRGLFYGFACFAAAVSSLVIGIKVDNGIPLLFALVFTGLGQGYAFMSSSVLATFNSDEHRRAANMSTFFMFCYTGAAGTVISIGWLADNIGLLPAVVIGSVLMLILMALLGVQAYRYAQEAVPSSSYV